MGPYNNEMVAILYHEERLRKAQRVQREREYLRQQRNDRDTTRFSLRRLWRWFKGKRTHRPAPRTQMTVQS